MITVDLRLLVAALFPHSHSLCVPLLVWPAGGLTDVWVLAGQSNCVGTNFEDGQSMPAAATPMPGQILCFNSSGRSVLRVRKIWLGTHCQDSVAGLGWAGLGCPVHDRLRCL